MGRDINGKSEYAAIRNDTLFLCKISVKNIVTIKNILRCFELASGLRVNLHKSRVWGVGITEDELKRSTIILNCGLMKVSLKYLGINIGGNPRQKQFWDLIENKVKQNLS